MMQKQKINPKRKKEIIDTCLKRFIENGLYKTSARDLADALEMQPSGLYYYFNSKDDIVIACAEEAGIRMEDLLILPFLECLDEPNQYKQLAEGHLTELVPMMHFFTQVCTTREYREAIQPVLDRLKHRHQEFAVRFAQRLGCSQEEVAPYLYACIVIFTNYMIFGEAFYYEEPFKILSDAVQDLKARKEQHTADEGGSI